MSKTTIRKRIALVAVTALTAGVFSAVSAPVANANMVGIASQAFVAGELGVAHGTNTTGATVTSADGTAALSLGLLYKDASSTTAQTATALAGGALVLGTAHSPATATAFVVTGGSLSGAVGGAGSGIAPTAIKYSNDLRTATMGGSNATAVAVRWALPTTAGTYTVTAYRSTNSTNVNYTTSSGTENVVADGTLFGQVTVTVVASAAAAGPVVANSTCSIATAATNAPASADARTTFLNGTSAYVNILLKDAYLSNNATSGNIVATVTGDAVVNVGDVSSSSGTVSAGTGSTVVAYGTGTSGSENSFRVSQATAGAPVTTTLTITFNGATICTKTFTIRGAPASMVISKVSSVKDGGSAALAGWLADGTNRDAHMYIELKDSAGNTVLPGDQTAGGVSSSDTPSNGGSTEFTIDSASVTNLITGFVVDSGDQATSISSSVTSGAWAASAGKYTCGSSQYGTQKVTIKHTSAATGKVITGTFDARCAGNAATYTASLDKASYTQGEIATLTVSFKDSGGRAANSQYAPGAVEMVMPMLGFVTATSVAGALPKTDGTMVYTLTAGTNSAVTAGTYNGIIDFTTLTAAAATKQTVTYKVTTGGDSTTNADVLKSIVALIASINKQIQALQKLILKR
jgi:hypothetical protein